MRLSWRVVTCACGLLMMGRSAAAHDDAVSQRQLARERAADPVALLLHQAGIARAEGRYLEAAALLDSASHRAPDSATLARCRAQLALDQDHPGAALRALERADDDARVPWLRADALTRLGRLDDAAAVMDAAIAHAGYTQREQVLARADVARRRASEGDAAAVAQLDAGLRRWPGAWELASRALDLEVGMGRASAALARIAALSAHSPARIELTVRQGDLLAGMGRALEAREAWTLALEALESRGMRGTSDQALANRLRAALQVPSIPEGTR